jgi:hypothetical protein
LLSEADVCGGTALGSAVERLRIEGEASRIEVMEEGVGVEGIPD